MRYLPSVIVFFVLCAYWVAEDRAHQRIMESEKRESATRILRSVQTQMDRFISRSLRASRRLALNIDSHFLIDQQAFEKIVETHYNGPGEIVRVELAPNFETRLVYPLPGNESYIGKIPLRPAAPGRPQLISDVERGFPYLSNISVLENGTAELHVRSEIREVVKQKVISNGMLRLVVQVDLTTRDPIEKLQEGELEFLFLVRSAGEAAPDLPTEWDIVPQGFEPISHTIHYPPGDILLYAKPGTGWGATSAEMLSYRMRYGLFGLLLLLPVLLANWFAVSRTETRGDLSKTQQQMSGLLRTLPGAALTYTTQATSSEHRLPARGDQFRFLNPESCWLIFGVDAEVVEADASSFWDVIETSEIAEDVVEELTESMQSMSTFDKVWPIVTPDGESKWILCRAHPIRLEDGAIQWSAFVLDNTEVIEREAELRKQREVAFRAQKNESIGQLTGGVAHDFNNLLAAISANLELVSLEDLSDIQNESLEAALDACQRGADLTRNMLSFARRAPLTPESFHLNDVIQAARSLIERTLPATVDVQLELGRPDCNVSADRSATDSALLNLILNARDAMDNQGLLTVATTKKFVDGNSSDSQLAALAVGDYAILSVSDTGSGIPSEHLQYIFDPFYSTKAPGKGSGLGLSMIMGFMQQSSGAVTVDTCIDRGTTISLYFPAVKVVNFSQRPRLEAVARKATAVRILFAEDDPAVRSALTRILELSGYQVVQASSGDEALELFNTDGVGFDLLLTDLVMPGKRQGPELAAFIRQSDQNFPVVFITGYAQETIPAMSEVMDIKKPVKHSELIDAVEKAMAAYLSK